tara:strand:+ start:276 stop:563 length:288 start_codon:yes stop_codon:yes gene_type:complete
MSYFKTKEGSLESSINEVSKHLKDNAYSQFFKKELEKTGKGIASMSDQEKKDFFNKVDKEYKAKAESMAKEKSKETMTGQKKTPVETEPKINYNK